MKNMDRHHALGDRLRSLSREERIPLLIAALKEHTAAVSGIAQESIDPEAPFVALSPLLGDVFTRNKLLIKPWVKKSLGFPSFWQYEASLSNSIAQLASYLASELETVMPETETFSDPYEGGGWGWPDPAAYQGEPLAHGRMAFVLGAGRSGTTLFRSMLSGHRQIYSPGELHLLPFDDMGQRQEALVRLQQHWMNAGLLDVLREQFGLTQLEALTTVYTLAAEKVPIVEIYRRIRERLEDHWLIDKSPGLFHPSRLAAAGGTDVCRCQVSVHDTSSICSHGFVREAPLSSLLGQHLGVRGRQPLAGCREVLGVVEPACPGFPA